MPICRAGTLSVKNAWSYGWATTLLVRTAGSEFEDLDDQDMPEVIEAEFEDPADQEMAEVVDLVGDSE
ncbi:uncharacterized protein PV06_03740 [Exophiala oligosperma]|uniref:Uncharacterized protein n=1 Tax=Exophiala oligosperma TaxID=215243 RepID=A0A0D2C6A1_9EURO|nr:uncharacterized protein PV06_03740 [Exophiala oligosperma]KIW45342.1 hypothetical protein PV06_03740 [Exophiala oligosperma]